jgi:hypothetical protein
MADITLRHEIACDEDTYWTKCVFNEEYNRRLFRDELAFPGFEVLEERDLGDTVHRKLRIDPPVAGLPGPLKKAIGDRLSYIEDGTFDKAAKRYRCTINPSSLGDKSKISADLRTEPLGDKRILRVVTVHIEVKVFAVGGLIEQKIADDLRASYDASARFTDAFVREKGF